jgi:hypothetical protein
MAAPRGGDLDQFHEASGCHFGEMLALKKRDPANEFRETCGEVARVSASVP